MSKSLSNRQNIDISNRMGGRWGGGGADRLDETVEVHLSIYTYVMWRTFTLEVYLYQTQGQQNKAGSEYIMRISKQSRAEQCDLYKKIMNYIIMSSLYIPRSHLHWFTEALPYIFWSISCKHKVKAIGTWQHIVKYMLMLQVFHIILKMYDNFR